MRSDAPRPTVWVREAVRASVPSGLAALALALGACGPREAPPAAAPTASKLALGPIRTVAAPVGAESTEPKIARGPDGSLVLSWLEPVGDLGDYALKYSRWTGRQWGAAAVAARGGNWYVNAADIPAVQPLGAQLWAAHWRVAQENDFAYDIMISVSADAGATWSEPHLLNDDGTKTEHGFVSLVPWGGDVGAIWLDGRETAGEEGEIARDTDAAPRGTTLRFARLGRDGAVLEQAVIDRLVCDCCTTNVASTADGVALVYRDRTPEEIRDVVVLRARAGAWSEPVQAGADHWRIEGCPVNGPAIAALGANVAVAWFTAPDGRARVRLAFSSDGAATFAPALDIDKEGPHGLVGVALADERTAFVSWWRRGAKGGADLAVRGATSGGELGPVTVVATSASSHPDDVPQVARSGAQLLVAWTDKSGADSVRTAVAELGGR